MAKYTRASLFSFVSALTVLLTGCGVGPVAAPTAVHGAVLKGVVHGGQNPVSGAQVYLLAAGAYNGGYRGASTSLLTSSTGNPPDINNNYYVTTDAGGNFSITGDYSCSAGTDVYLYAVGGNPGSGTNSGVGLLAALGDCGNLPSIGSVIVNEVTTVATAFALAGYSTDATHIASTGHAAALKGVANAFANVNNLVNINGGYAYATTPAGNGVAPQRTINTLANILAACVNSADNEDNNGNFVSNSTNCSTLFSNATSSGVANTGTQPTDTATAAINIALFPGSNTAALYGLPTGVPPFAPALVGPDAPTDFILGIQYSGAGLNNPGGIAIDASGNAWITNYTGNSVTELTNLGAPVTGEPSTGYTDASMNEPSGIAIDATGNVWVANFNGADVTELIGTGESLTTNDIGLGLGTASGGTAVAVDSSGNVWVTSPTTGSQGNVLEIAASNAAVSTYGPATLPNLAGPTGIAADTLGDVWVTNSGSQTLYEINPIGSPVNVGSAYGIYNGGVGAPFSVALDNYGNIWATNADNAVIEFAQNGPGMTSFYTLTSAGALNNPEGIAIDGGGNAWIADEYSNKNITEILRGGTLATGESSTEGYIGGGLTYPAGIAVDGSGDVWVTNGNPNGTSTTVTELIGVATPVVTPLAASLITPYDAPASLP